jgi:hypothetical protein
MIKRDAKACFRDPIARHTRVDFPIAGIPHAPRIG